MRAKYWLVKDATPGQVETVTGLRGALTPQGTIVEAPPDMGAVYEQVAAFERMLNPNRCTCGAWAIMHRPGCPTGGGIT